MEIVINTSLHMLMSADSLAAKYLNMTNMSQKRSGLHTTYVNEYNRLNNYFIELFPANKQITAAIHVRIWHHFPFEKSRDFD